MFDGEWSHHISLRLGDSLTDCFLFVNMFEQCLMFLQGVVQFLWSFFRLIKIQGYKKHPNQQPKPTTKHLLSIGLDGIEVCCWSYLWDKNHQQNTSAASTSYLKEVEVKHRQAQRQLRYSLWRLKRALWTVLRFKQWRSLVSPHGISGKQEFWH